jgi:hypothetical protein
VLQRETPGNLDGKTARTIIGELQAAIKLRPQFIESYERLGHVALESGENLKAGIEAMQAVLRLAPQTQRYRLTLAQLQIRSGDMAAARVTLAPLLASDERGLKLSAQNLMQEIEDQTQPRTESAITLDRGNLAAGGGSQGSASAPSAPQQFIGKPTLRVEGAEVIRGTLTMIECAKGKWTLVVNVQDKLRRFTVTNTAQLKLYSQDPSFEGSVGCGKVMHAAFIYYKPLADKQTRFAGDAVAIEFTK